MISDAIYRCGYFLARVTHTSVNVLLMSRQINLILNVIEIVNV